MSAKAFLFTTALRLHTLLLRRFITRRLDINFLAAMENIPYTVYAAIKCVYRLFKLPTLHHLQGVERVISTKYLAAPFLLAVLKAVLLQLEAQGLVSHLVSHTLL